MNISVPDHFFPENYLEKIANDNKEAYQTAEPFSHASFENFLPEEYLEKVLAEFPDVDDPQWYEYKFENANKKLASQSYEKIPPYTRYVLGQLNSPPFLQFLETLSGIKGLIPDPYYAGGGMHQIKRGGHLGIHVDFNKNGELKLYRRINVLIYLNKNWKDEYGGHLELWDEEVKNCLEKIAPRFNTCAIFTTSENSHHGHPDPLNCPENMTRKSLALYYYTVEKSEIVADQSHTTLFKPRPGKDFKFKVYDLKIKTKEIIKNIAPPILIKIAKKFFK